MSGKEPRDGPVEVARVDVRRVSPEQLVLKDDFLKGCDLVRALGDHAAALLCKGTPLRFAPDARLFNAGDEASSLLLVLKGEVRLLRQDGQGELGSARRGELVDEAGGDARRTCAAVADGEVHVLELPNQAVAEAKAGSPALGRLLDAQRARRTSTSTELDDFLKRW